MTANSLITEHPLLHKNSLDYEEPDAYEAEVEFSQEGRSKAEVSHRLSPGNLVYELVRDGKAVFACLESMPGLLHRKLHRAPSREHIEASPTQICYQQRVEIFQQSEITKHKRKFHLYPVVVLKKKLMLTPGGRRLQKETIGKVDVLDAQDTAGVYGLSGLRKNSPASFPTGAVLAFDKWFVSNNAGQLFSRKLDEQMPRGAFSVGVTEVDDSFKITIGANKEVVNLLDKGDNPDRRHVLCAALVQVFADQAATVREDGQDDDNDESPNYSLFIEAIEKKIKEKMEPKEETHYLGRLNGYTLQEALTSAPNRKELPCYLSSLIYRILLSGHET